MKTSALRTRKMRERRKEGIRVLPVEVHRETVETLVELDYLNVEDAYNVDAVAIALAAFINNAVESVTCHSITLDVW